MARPITLITGTRIGIGKFLAEYFVNKGHLVCGCSRNTPDWDLEGYEHYIVDIVDEGAVKNMLSEIRRKHGRLDNLINNAGIASMNHCLLTPLSTIQRVMNTNLVGTFLLCREAAKLMQAKRYGRIVNFSTVAVPMKLQGEAAYVASKAAIVAMSQVMAGEFGGVGITVNVIGPTPVDTDLIRAVPSEKIEQLISRQMIKRMGTFEDVANVADFFLRPESNFVTGQSIYLGGL